MTKGLILKIIAIILISTVGIMFGGYAEQMKVNPTGIYSSVEKTKTAKETVKKAEGFKEVEEFKDYDKKDLKGMEKIQMQKYSVYIPTGTQQHSITTGKTIYTKKAIKFTISLGESEMPENCFADVDVTAREYIKKTYGKDISSSYESMYFTYLLQTKKYKDDEVAKVYNGAAAPLGLNNKYSRVYSYDNGKVKGFIGELNLNGFIDFKLFSKDEKEYVWILLKADYNTMCKVVNSVEFTK